MSEMLETEAWVLYAGEKSKKKSPANLRLETFSFPNIKENEVLVEPLIGCWEGNMSHALERQPIDICHQRAEAKVVIGNAGVVRVLRSGSAVENLSEGDLCLVFCNGIADSQGFAHRIWAYDAPGTIGLLARRTKMTAAQLIKIPANSKYSLGQWAAFSLRYITAWANWEAAYACWRAVSRATAETHAWVFGWGGGATLAELTLAQHYNCSAIMSAAGQERCDLIESLGMTALDRNKFDGLSFDADRYLDDAEYRRSYRNAEETFLESIKAMTGGEYISILVDYIGLPVYRASLKALKRPGVLTSAGWKEGMSLSTLRSLECMNWHVHVHTHYARYPDGLAAVSFGEKTGWMPPENDDIFSWEAIPQLAQQYVEGKLNSYFPLFRINH